MTGVLFGIAARSSPEMPPLSTALRDTPAGIARSSSHSLRGPSARSSRMPRESLDAPEDLPKQARQVALGQLEDKVSRMRPRRPPIFGIAAAGGSSGPTLDGERQNQPAQEIAEVVGDDAQEQPHLIGPEAVAGKFEDLLRTRAGLTAWWSPRSRDWPSNGRRDARKAGDGRTARRPRPPRARLQRRPLPSPTNSGASVAHHGGAGVVTTRGRLGGVHSRHRSEPASCSCRSALRFVGQAGVAWRVHRK